MTSVVEHAATNHHPAPAFRLIVNPDPAPPSDQAPPPLSPVEPEAEPASTGAPPPVEEPAPEPQSASPADAPAASFSDMPSVAPEPQVTSPADVPSASVPDMPSAAAEPEHEATGVPSAVGGSASALAAPSAAVEPQGEAAGGVEDVDGVLAHPVAAVAEEPRAAREIDEARARGLVLEAWHEARLSSPSGRVHFLSTVDSWLERGWSAAFYASGARVTVYSCGAPDAWLPTAMPPRRLARPRGAGRLLGVYAGPPLFPGAKADYQVPGVETAAVPFAAELVVGVHGDDLFLMAHDEAVAGVGRLDAAFSARTYGEARDLGLEVDDRRRCLDYYVELCCRAHEDVDEQFLRARSTQDLWNAVRPADDQPFDLDEHPCFGDSDWRPAPTVRGPWADAAFRERFGPIDREWPSGRERLPAAHVNDVLAHLRTRGWSVARDDTLFAAYHPDA